MIACSKLYCGKITESDSMRYGPDKHKKPIVVWNMTKQCNLHCVHCYINAKGKPDANELTTETAKKLIDDLAEFQAPVLLFSGGEPLIREDMFELGAYSVQQKLRTVISTNGTLITPEVAKKIKDTGFSYVGISIDGLENTNDKFRGEKGAFNKAIKGIHNCIEAGVKVGLRFTINKNNFSDLKGIFDLIEKEKIPRVCFYHLVYAGRGTKMIEEDVSHKETKEALDLILEKCEKFHKDKVDCEILTVDNHTDGPYLYMKLKSKDEERAKVALKLLEINGGNSTGIGIAEIDNLGEVHADQFWQHYSFGNIHKRKFSEIWMDTSDPLMAGLKNRKKLLKGKCAECKWLSICNGNFRVRAEAYYQDVWAEDPACYI